MKTDLTTVPVGIIWLASKLGAWKQKRQTVVEADAIDNLERLHQLKEKGILSNEEFAELKEKLKARI